MRVQIIKRNDGIELDETDVMYIIDSGPVNIIIVFAHKERLSISKKKLLDNFQTLEVWP